MALTSGTRLRSYEVLAQIGAGGMGEVYRDRDSKLGRDVAIKVLPANFVNDPERLSRFQREAHAGSAELSECRSDSWAGAFRWRWFLDRGIGIWRAATKFKRKDYL